MQQHHKHATPAMRRHCLATAIGAALVFVAVGPHNSSAAPPFIRPLAHLIHSIF